MISIKQIRYALAVEKTLHFRKAADNCAVSQSALSTALNELEAQLGFQVFERDNKKVLVTPMGRIFLEKARSVSVQMDDIARLRQTDKAPLSTPLTVGMIPTIAPYLLPLVLPAVAANYPAAKLKIVEAQSKELVERVRDGELDTAVLALPYDCENLLSFPFWDEDFYWVAPSDDEQEVRERITSEELSRENLMLLSEGHCLKDHALAACKFSNAVAHSMSATSLNTLIQLVVAGLGSTLVPEMALDQLVRNDKRLQYARLDEPGPHRKIAFIMRATYPKLDSIQALQEVFTKALSNR